MACDDDVVENETRGGTVYVKRYPTTVECPDGPLRTTICPPGYTKQIPDVMLIGDKYSGTH